MVVNWCQTTLRGLRLWQKEQAMDLVETNVLLFARRDNLEEWRALEGMKEGRRSRRAMTSLS